MGANPPSSGGSVPLVMLPVDPVPDNASVVIPGLRSLARPCHEGLKSRQPRRAGRRVGEPVKGVPERERRVRRKRRSPARTSPSLRLSPRACPKAQAGLYRREAERHPRWPPSAMLVPPTGAVAASRSMRPRPSSEESFAVAGVPVEIEMRAGQVSPDFDGVRCHACGRQEA